MKRVIIIIFLSSLTFLLSSTYENKESKEIIILENIKEIQFTILKSNKTSFITNPKQITYLVNVIKKINAHNPNKTNEEEVIYHIYVIPEGYYPEGAISITKNQLIYKGYNYSLENSELETILSIVD